MGIELRRKPVKAKIMRSDLEELLRLLRKYKSTRILMEVIHSLVQWYGPRAPTDKVVAVLELMGVEVTDE